MRWLTVSVTQDPAQKSSHTQAMVLGVRAQDQLMTWLTLTMICFVQLPINTENPFCDLLLTACESPLLLIGLILVETQVKPS